MQINNPTTFSTPDLTLTTSNSSGNAGALRADDSILVYDTSVPTNVGPGDAASAGNTATAARRNHQHGVDATLAYVKQVKTTQTGAVSTGTTIFPVNDTIPQNDEGDQYLTLAITPGATDNRLIIQTTIMAGRGDAGWWGVGLFQDSTANALAAEGVYSATGTGASVITYTHEMDAGTTSSTTFKVRAGPSTTSTLTVNGAGGGRYFGGVCMTSLIIWEIET